MNDAEALRQMTAERDAAIDALKVMASALAQAWVELAALQLRFEASEPRDTDD